MSSTITGPTSAVERQSALIPLFGAGSTSLSRWKSSVSRRFVPRDRYTWTGSALGGRAAEHLREGSGQVGFGHRRLLAGLQVFDGPRALCELGFARNQGRAEAFLARVAQLFSDPARIAGHLRRDSRGT